MTSAREFCTCDEPGHTMTGACMDCGGKVGHNHAPTEGARDAGVGAAAEPRAWLVEWKIGADIWVAAHASEVSAVDQARKNNGTCTPLYAHPDPLLAEAVEALREISEQADDSYALGSGNHRRVTLGRIHERASIVLAKVQAAKEQAA